MNILKNLVFLKIRNDFILRVLNYIDMSDIVWTPKKLEVSEEDLKRIRDKKHRYEDIYDIKYGFALTRAELLGKIGELFFIDDDLYVLKDYLMIGLTERIPDCVWEAEGFETSFSYLQYCMDMKPQKPYVISHKFLKIVNGD